MSAASIVQALVEFAPGLAAEYDADDVRLDATPEVLAIMLGAIRDTREDLAKLYAEVERDLLAIAGEKRFVVEGFGEVSIHRRTKRTAWRHDEMIPAVIARVMDEPATIYDEDGTLLPYVTIGHNVARRLRECVGFGAGKVTGLRAIGLAPDEFCDETPDGYSVQLPKRVSS